MGYKKGQYPRIKAWSLATAGDPMLRAAARALFQRILREFPDQWFEVVGAHEALGLLYERDGLFAQAEQHYRECVVLCTTVHGTYSGTSGHPELLLAELILRSGQANKYQEAEALLAEFDQDKRTRARLVFNSHRYRYAVAAARVKARLGKRAEAAAFAQVALQLAAVNTPQFSRHPGVGMPQPDADTIAEMSALLSNITGDRTS